MKKFFLFFLPFLAAAPLAAAPAVLENAGYKVTLSETLPGLDAVSVPQQGPTITVTVLDKLRFTSASFPLPVYAIQDYFLADSALDLMTRTNPLGSQGGPRFDFYQLNLESPDESRRYGPVKRFSLSPDNQAVLARFDGGDKPDAIVLILDSSVPAVLYWLYGPQAGMGLFQKAIPSLTSPPQVQDPVAWAADSMTAAFLVTTGKDADEIEPGRTYLTALRLDGDGPQIAVNPVDLSPYGYGRGAVVVRAQCAGNQAAFFLTRPGSADVQEADFPLPEPGKSRAEETP
jgi:hypothetical protein